MRGGRKYVREITYHDAKPFLLEVHYARRMPPIQYAFGLFVDEKMVGCVTFGTPASRPLCIGLAGIENADRVLELNRLVILPGYEGQNLASYLISRALKKLPKPTFVVSYADTAWTHVGYVYQATNWLYTGVSARRMDTYQPGGKHPRAYDKNDHSNLKQTRSSKHRYVYLVGDRRQRKEMRNALRYKVVDQYPKGDEIRYDVACPKAVNPIKVIRANEREKE